MRSKAAILVAPNTPLVIEEVIFPGPAPDQVRLKLFAKGAAACYPYHCLADEIREEG
jgi:Zn-dependent alcohol dehydrogenase